MFLMIPFLPNQPNPSAEAQEEMVRAQRKLIPRRCKGESEGGRFRYETYRDGYHLALRLELKAPRTRGDFTILLEDKMDALFKRLGLVEEVQSGDAEFDARYYIHSDARPFAESFFAEPEIRRLVRELFDIGCRRVRYTGRKLLCRARLPTIVKFMSHDAIVNEYVHRLIMLGRGIERLREIEYEKVPASLRTARYATKALPWLFVIVGMAAHLVVRYFYPLVDFSAAWKLLTAGGLIVWAGIAYQMLWKQKRLWYPRSLVLAALGWLVSLFAFPSGAAMLLNGALDRSEPVIREARVVDISEGRSNDSSDYVHVESWRKPGKTLRVHVLSVSGIIPHGTMMRATTRRGFLGLEWMTQQEFYRPPKPARQAHQPEPTP
jgi:hypothetical protein